MPKNNNKLTKERERAIADILSTKKSSDKNDFRELIKKKLLEARLKRSTHESLMYLKQQSKQPTAIDSGTVIEQGNRAVIEQDNREVASDTQAGNFLQSARNPLVGLDSYNHVVDNEALIGIDNAQEEQKEQYSDDDFDDDNRGRTWNKIITVEDIEEEKQRTM